MTKPYRILITGSRTWVGFDRLSLNLGLAIGEAYNAGRPPLIVHGSCPDGADAMADKIAQDYRWAVERHPAIWRPGGVFDKSAGFRRNAEMVALGADVCLAFIRNGSRGATHCADLAEKAHIPVRRFTDA